MDILIISTSHWKVYPWPLTTSKITIYNTPPTPPPLFFFKGEGHVKGHFLFGKLCVCGEVMSGNCSIFHEENVPSSTENIITYIKWLISILALFYYTNWLLHQIGVYIRTLNQLYQFANTETDPGVFGCCSRLQLRGSLWICRPCVGLLLTNSVCCCLYELRLTRSF